MNDLSVSVSVPSGPAPSMAALPEARAKITVRDLNFYYGENHALKNINLALGANRVTAFIGPSGCGKSTLLRIFNRMYDLYPGQRATGQLMLDQTDVLDPKLDLNLLRARVGMVFQKPTPFPMTIYENIAFGIRLYEKISRAAARCGTRSRTSSTPLASACPGASSSGSVSPVPWPCAPRSFCSTSRARRWIRFRPPRSRN